MADIVKAKVTSKCQVTVPRKVRDALEIGEGDFISCEVHDNTAVIKKIPRVDAEWARAEENTLTEWNDELDDEL